eukprot:143561-Chlamydomonas_euryale.AAC.2
MGCASMHACMHASQPLATILAGALSCWWVGQDSVAGGGRCGGGARLHARSRASGVCARCPGAQPGTAHARRVRHAVAVFALHPGECRERRRRKSHGEERSGPQLWSSSVSADCRRAWPPTRQHDCMTATATTTHPQYARRRDGDGCLVTATRGFLLEA